jgi:small subunit ribosomal protein S2
MIDLKKLVGANVHFGHKSSRWHPKMAPFIWGTRNDIHLINVAQTAYQMEKAAQFLESLAAQKRSILIVGTKKVSQSVVEEIGKKLNNPYVVHRWIGGTLTNWANVKKCITKLLHAEDVLAKADQYAYTKKERASLQKDIERLQRNVGTIRNFSWPIGALILVDVKKEQTALREALSVGVPVVALVDTNCDPSMVDYVIPCNDDATSSVKVVLDYLADAIERGKQKAATQAVEAAQETTNVAHEKQEVLQLREEDGDEQGKARRKREKEEAKLAKGREKRPAPRQKTSK